MKKLTIKDVKTISISLENWEVKTSYIKLGLTSDFWHINVGDTIWIRWDKAEININEIIYLSVEEVEEEGLDLCSDFSQDILNLLNNSY